MLAFDSYSYAVRAGQLLAGEVPSRVMPTLRCVSESCGMSLRLAADDGPRAERVLSVSELPRAVWRRYLVYGGGSRAELCAPAGEG